MANSENHKYEKIYYEMMHKFDVSIVECFLLSMVLQLSKKSGWCYKKLDLIAAEMKLSRRTVVNLRDNLVQKKLLVKGKNGRLCTTVKVQNLHDLLTNSAKSARLEKKPEKIVQNLHPIVQNLHTNSAKSAHITDGRYTIDKQRDKKTQNFNKSGYKKAKQMRDKIKQRG